MPCELAKIPGNISNFQDCKINGVKAKNAKR